MSLILRGVVYGCIKRYVSARTGLIRETTDSAMVRLIDRRMIFTCDHDDSALQATSSRLDELVLSPPDDESSKSILLPDILTYCEFATLGCNFG